jgi:glutathione S-transferase
MANSSELPILYSFRRCPYAMRARLAVSYAGIPVALREVVLKYKPDAMLAASPKGTVPVLVLPNGRVVDESLDIMHWALAQNDPDNWSLQGNAAAQAHAAELIATNDGAFKRALDRYKYADRHPEQPAEAYRKQGEAFLQTLEARLAEHPYLLRNAPSIADMAIFPFIRQFAHVDKAWFEQAGYPRLLQWLETFLSAPLFTGIMHKYPAWQPDDAVTVFHPASRQSGSS